MYKLVLIRHGESQWNLENRFTGWHDVDLTDTGVAQAKTAGQLLKDAGFTFDQAYTSVLLRAIKTLNIALEEMGQHYLPVERHWRLNERHYGALTGLDKAETAAKQVKNRLKSGVVASTSHLRPLKMIASTSQVTIRVTTM